MATHDHGSILKAIYNKLLNVLGYHDKNPGFSNFRSLLVDTDEVTVKATAGNLYGWNIINRAATDIYVKFYDVEDPTAINPASDVPVLTLPVPVGSVYQEPNCSQHYFTNSIAVRAVTGSADTDATDPATLPIIELKYK